MIMIIEKNNNKLYKNINKIEEKIENIEKINEKINNINKILKEKEDYDEEKKMKKI